MAAALESALETAPTLPRDAAAVKLAREYARLLDDAAVTAKYRPHLRRLWAALPPGVPEVAEAFEKIRDALGEHTTASDLGPKYLAVLNALGMTAAGRSAKGGPADGPRVPDELAELRTAAARRRAGGAG